MIRITRSDSTSAAELILSDRPRTILPHELNALTFVERLALIRGAHGRRKYDLIVEAVDGERVVEELPAQDLYLLMRELGIEDVPELLAYSTTEQLTAYLDLDCWNGDHFDEKKGLNWLIMLLECGEEKVVYTAQELELEVLALLFKKQIRILHGPEDVEDEDVRFEVLVRVGGYALEYRDPEYAKQIAAFLDILAQRDNENFLRLMETLRWETESELEEEAYGYHCGRRLDLGFPVPGEALNVYAWLDPERFDAVAERKRPVIAYGDDSVTAFAVLSAGHPSGLLATALAAGIDEATAAELAHLMNKVLAAERVDLGDLAQVRAVADRVFATLNLGLEHLCGVDRGGADTLLRERYTEALFRLGFSLTLRLQRRARAVAASSIAPFLDGPFRAGIEALGRNQPAFYEGIVQPTRAGERPFAALSDLVAAETWLAGVEAQQRFFEACAPFSLPTAESCDLSGCEPNRIEDVTLSDLLLTALANRLLGRSFLPRPIAAEELPGLHGRLCRDGQVDAPLRCETLAWLEQQTAGAGSFGEWCLALWEEGLCATPVEELDPRYIDGLIVRVPR